MSNRSAPASIGQASQDQAPSLGQGADSGLSGAAPTGAAVDSALAPAAADSGLGPARNLLLSGRYGFKPANPKDDLLVTVRVDVDRFFPQHCLSVTVWRQIARTTAHVVARVTSDQVLGRHVRTITATVFYRDGEAQMMPGDRIVFQASGTDIQQGYQEFALTLAIAGAPERRYPLVLESPYFDPVDLEVDRVENAGEPALTYHTNAHPNRPANLPTETLSLATIYQRAGFATTMSPNSQVIPLSAAGVNGTWSTAELHDAMATYWSLYANRPQWAMWMLYAARHDLGRNVGGLMFDDMGANQRRGAAMFSESFLFDAPAGDPAPKAWRQRMLFFIMTHEIGHTFNLAHSFQKAFGTGQGAPGDPWIPLQNEPEARSFMNYPSLVSGGQQAFFSDFRFRFSDDELLFMRHAPRRFVQMGNNRWFVDHGFVAPELIGLQPGWRLDIRPNRELNVYRFLEPVTLEFKLTNISDAPASYDADALVDGHHLTVFIRREGAPTVQWRPMATLCMEERQDTLAPGASIYGTQMVSACSSGWLIDQPGFYQIQAVLDVGLYNVVSNVLRIYVAPSRSFEEDRLALDYFSEDVGRALVFGATPGLARAAVTLEELVRRCPDHAAAIHAAVALATPKLRDHKRLVAADDGSLAIRCDRAAPEAAAEQIAPLLQSPQGAADTLGHIPYFETLDRVASALDQAGDVKKARDVLQTSVATMKQREVLPSVIRGAERKLDAVDARKK